MHVLRAKSHPGPLLGPTVSDGTPSSRRLETGELASTGNRRLIRSALRGSRDARSRPSRPSDVSASFILGVLSPPRGCCVSAVCCT